MADILLRTESVGVTFGALAALKDVSLAVSRGERRGIIGPNGAGKTTLFNSIAGSIIPTDGKIWFGQRDITRMAPDRRAVAGIGRTFQITNLFGRLTVRENILMSVRGRNASKFSLFRRGDPSSSEQAIIEKALSDSNLTARAETNADELSYGEQRQLELALALAGRPTLLLLDEPAAGLSPAERVTIAAVVRALPRDLTIILIEHDIDLALSLVDHVTCLHFGQVLCEGRPDEISSDPRVQEVYLGKPRHARGA
jgi:branched-chain amino acid transport system ATP-binding protein